VRTAFEEPLGVLGIVLAGQGVADGPRFLGEAEAGPTS
jgi:hypothetical protein